MPNILIDNRFPIITRQLKSDRCVCKCAAATSDNSTSVITMPEPGRRYYHNYLACTITYTHSAVLHKTILCWIWYCLLLKSITWNRFCRLPLLVVAITSSVVQLLVKPDISQHPPQLPLRPNVQTLRYLNFGPRQILVIAIRGTFAFWHADISSFQRKLALSAWDQNLRRENG